MKRLIKIPFCLFLILLQLKSFAQTTNPAPYCNGTYGTGQCNQPGPSNSTTNFINDFIDNFSTTGGNTNISNLNSGCNGGTNNYMNYCNHYLAVSPGQTLVCTMSSGITFGQGFAIWVDWDQDNTFNTTTEYMGGTAGVPAPATPTTITFVIPTTQPNGVYRMRVRCAFATIGSGISPCGTFGFGETEDYTIYVGAVPPNSAMPTGTALVNTPVCVGQSLSFSLVTNYTAPLSYTWTGPNSYSSTMQNPSIFNSSTAASGIYTVLVTNSICPMTTTVAALVIPYPTFTPVANQYTVCQGGNLVTTASLITSSSLYTFSWTSTNPGVIFNPQQQITTIQPPLLPSNVALSTIVYSIAVTPTIHPACAVTKTIGITVNNPLTPTLTMPPPLCDIFSPVQLTATPGGGTWSANAAVAPSGIYTPSLSVIGPSNTVLYSVSIGTCVATNTAYVSVSRFHTAALTSSFNSCVLDPQFNLMNIVQDTTNGHWSGFHVQNNLFSPAGLATGNYTLTHYTFSSPNTSVCPASTVLVVPVFNPPLPVITPILPKCDINPTVALTASPPGGVWSGNPGVTAAGIRTPSLNFVGTNTVFYTAGQGTCVATSSATFHLSRFNTADLSGVAPKLCANNNPFNLMSIVQNTNGSWGPSNSPYMTTPNVFNPSALPTNYYTVLYTTTSTPIAGLCNDTSSIAIHVLNPPVPVIAPKGPYCSVSAPIQLSVFPAIGYWITTPYLTSGGLFTPSLSPLGNNSVQYVIGTNTCNTNQTAIIQVEAFVPASLIGSLEEQCTSNLPVPLTPLVSNSSGYWTGTGSSGNYFNPASAGAGNFTLIYHTASYPSGLCPDQSTLAVNVFSLAPPSITQVGPFCNATGPVQLVVSPVGGIFGTGGSNAITSYGLFNPALAAIGDNFINYTVTVGPCRAEAQTKISVEAFIPADLGNMLATTFCRNQEPINLNSFVQYVGGSWTGPGVVGNMFYPELANTGNTNFLSYETISPKSLCRDTSQIRVTIREVPVVSATADRYNGCTPVVVKLNSPSFNSGKGTWNISDGTQYTGLSATHTFNNPGTYTVVYTYEDEDVKSCSAQYVIPTSFVVQASPKVDFSYSPEEVTIADPEILITNQSTVLNDNNYVWTIQGQQGQLRDLHPKVKFTQPGNYKITLTATSIYGCRNETSKIIEVKNNFNVHIPNSFTPNYDGLNDVFIPVFTSYGLDARTFEMEIFDRWGHQVFRSRDASKGWDGTVAGGEIAKEDTYIYKIRYKDLDGRIYNTNGHLTLLRNN